MINSGKQSRESLRTNGPRRILALLAAFVLMISSGGLTALAESGDSSIYSAPVTAPAAAGQPETTPGLEENPETLPEGSEADGIPEEPSEGRAYYAGFLTAETENCSVRMDCTAEARVPEGSLLSVEEIRGADLYEAMKAASKLIQSGNDAIWSRQVSDEGSRFFLVKLTDADGSAVIPHTGVTLICDTEVPNSAVCVLTGSESRVLEANDGRLLITDYRMEPFGYAMIETVQTGTVTLRYTSRDYTVTASYGPEAKLPADTELKVREIRPGTQEYALYSGMTEEALDEEWSEITLERYFDITFSSGGMELEPQADVDVQIVFNEVIELTESIDVQAVHIENNEATVIESETDSTERARHNDDAIDTVSFSSGSFSVYGVVQRRKITKKVLAADGNTYEINVSYGPEANIPEGAELKVEEIPEGSSLWEAYRKQTAAALRADDVLLPGLYDIAIIADGQAVEPAAPLNVSIRLDNAESDEELHVVHFMEEIPAGLVAAMEAPTEGQPAAEEEKIRSEIISAEVEGKTVTFETDGFSVYAFAYTVDFHYNDTDVSIQGGSQVLLSALIARLNITDAEGILIDVNDVVSVSFTDGRLVTVEEVTGETEVNGEKVIIDGKDFLLTSNEPFTSAEQLVLALTDGSGISVDVTDEQESTDLAGFLTKVTVSGASIVNGSYVVEPNTPYNITMVFKENQDLQFANEQVLTYQLPDGVTLPTTPEGSTIKIAVVSGGKTYEVPAIVTTGGTTVTVKFDETDPYYSKLASSTNVSFRISVDALITRNITSTEWSEEIEKDIILDTEDHSDVFTVKSGVFDPETGTFHYTIKVTSNGNTTNVNVKDIISGNALIFNNDVQITGNSSNYTVNALPAGQNGFDYTFASMADSEEITITYTASLDPGVTLTADGKVTVDQTKNTVTVQKEGGDPHTAEYSQEINLKKPDKSDGTEAGTTADGKKLYNWTIDYNALALVSAAGDIITDTIGEDSREYMQYYGDVTVKIYDHDGRLQDTRHFTPGTSSWSYTVPAADTAPYHYVFEYQTAVDQGKVDQSGKALQLTNSAAGVGGTDYAAISVSPKESVTITKEVESFNPQEVTWVSHIHVPETGLSSAVVTDTVPSIYSGNIGVSGNYTLYDAYKNGSLEITGLLPGESFAGPDVTGNTVVITFYKDAGQSVPGLNGNAGGRDITIRLTTEVNQTWLQYNYDHPGGYQASHTNNININGIPATATVVFSKPDIEKSLSEQTEQRWFRYTLVLSGVTEEPINIEDTFDTNLLEVATDRASAWYHFVIFGGHQWSQDNGRTSVNYSDTPTGISITANTVPRQPDGEFYPYYKITYYLRLKDGVDLHELAVENGGTFDLTNTAKWGDHESSYTYRTKYDYLNKEILQRASSENRNVIYKITFNPEKGEVSGGDPITLTDRLNEYLSVDYTSIRIVTDPANVTIPYSFSGDGPETVATYTIPDSTAVTITYSAMVVGNGPVAYKNTVTANGETKEVTETANIQITGEGAGAVADLKITKVDGYDANKKLAGVRFKLYSENHAHDLSTKNDTHVYEKEIVTDSNGILHIYGEDTRIVIGAKYYLEEIAAPDGYQNLSFPYQFTLVDDMDAVDYTQFRYFFDDSFQIKNWPLEGLVVGKSVVSNEAADHTKFYSFHVSILNEDSTDVDTSVNRTYGDMEFINGVASFELRDKEQLSAWNMPAGTKFKVEEMDADGFTVSTTVGETTTEGSTYSGETSVDYTLVTFTNTKQEEEPGSLKVRKTVTENGSSENLSDAAKTVLAGDYTFTIYTDEACNTPYQVNSQNVTVTVTIGPNGGTATSDEVTDMPAGDYWIMETEPDNKAIQPGNNPVKVTVEAGKTGEDAVIAEFTNNIETVTKTGEKIWEGNEERPDIWLRLVRRAGNAVQTDDTTEADVGTDYEMVDPDVAPIRKIPSGGLAAEPWVGLPKYAPDGEEYEYAVIEVDADGHPWVPEGYTKIEYGMTVTNKPTDTYDPRVNYTVTKAWDDANAAQGTRPEHLTVNLYADRTLAGEPGKTEVTESSFPGMRLVTTETGNTWLYTFENLPVFAQNGEVIKYTAEEVVPDGYEKTENIVVTEYNLGDPSDIERVTPCNQVELTITNDKDLAYVIIKKGGKFIIWTQRPATQQEKDRLDSLASGAIGGFNTGSRVFHSGFGDFSFSGNTVTISLSGMTIVLNFHASATWSYFGKGTYPSAYTEGSAEFTNKVKPGNLELTKKVSGDGADSNKEFEFTIALTAPDGETLKPDYSATHSGDNSVNTATISDGKVTGIKLKPDQKYTIIGLPAGTAYTITEEDYSADGYTSDISDGGKTGIITGGTRQTEQIEVTNNFSSGELVVTKTVAGNAAETNREFSFNVTLTDAAVNGIYGQYGPENAPVVFINGVATFSLKDGGTARIMNLPVGTEFTVEEIVSDQNGYETTVTVTGNGVINADKTVTGSISAIDATTATFTNTRNTTFAEAAKKWVSGETPIGWPEDVASVDFILYKKVGEEKTTVTANDLTGYWTDEELANFDNPVQITKDYPSAMWEKLPDKYLVEGSWVVAEYTVEETKVTYTNNTTVEGDDLAATWNPETTGTTITNHAGPTTYKVRKTWGEGQQPPEGAVIQIELGTVSSQESTEAPTALDPRQVVILNGGREGGNDTSEPWEYEWTDLPKYDNEGNVIFYRAIEISYKIGEAIIDISDAMAPSYTNDANYQLIATNKIPTTSIKAKKIWPDGQNLPANTTVKLAISATVSNGTGGTTVPSGVTVSPTEVTLDGVPDTNEPICETIAWEYEWKNLPQYDGNGKLITYTVTETGYKIGEDDQTPANADPSPASGYQFSFTNTLPTTDIVVEKAWSPTGWPTDIQSVTVGLFQSVNGSDATAVTSGDPAEQKTLTFNGSSTETERAFSGLPVYDRDGNLITYSVQEIAVTSADGHKISVVNGAVTVNGKTWTVLNGAVSNDGKATVTNTFSGISINVTKQWTQEGSPKTTANSISFTLYQVLTPADAGESLQPAVYTGYGSNGVGTVNYTNGAWEVVTILNLPKTVTREGVTCNASYYVVETGAAADAGYILSTMYSDGITENADGSAVAVNTNNSTITIINTETAGAILPATGGPGTAAWYLGGSLLVLAALALFLRRRQRAKNTPDQ